MSRSFQIADYLLGKIDLIPNYLFGIAIEARSLEFVQNLLKKQNLPENISNGRSLLFWIIIHYDKDIFSLLVKHVTDFQEQFTYNETLMNPLIFAISLMRGKECIQILIDKCLIHDYSDVLIKTAEMAIRSDEWYYNEILELLLKFKPIDHEIEMKIFQFAKANNNQDLIRIMLNSDRNNIVKSILEEKNYKLEDEYGYRYISSNEKIHSEVFLKLKRNRFDIDGFDENGFDTIGFDRAGFDNEGFNRNGFDKDGFGRDGFNKKGFNRDGYDKFGYDKYGYDTLGYDRNGYNIDGYDRDGFGRDGYDMYGYDSEGFGRDGYNRGDIYKYDSDYYHSRNSRRRHYYGMYDYDNDRFYDFY
ncbi:hypothetical protein TVAG_262100 [Trichomonas vaginalis G3]|uniref:Uncharacterized protein n=1 Tax=Trichomonas vaginalis (strain ATCC PRA-98 / G3) TaxID=412133 RepID=A2DUC2_TRIV3|nr:spectrin binding [Trichomonas vaginalis G3]EAY15960.1 hypothetical protein TVAG_262100 [Trichomonas vaginalis G3]KAI5523594.1 spectrin binding [Trichomonas vaginalis G3]|eukprot:XP_001328183.1 hypothetical protein [Trichomonas vaginalis G3]